MAGGELGKHFVDPLQMQVRQDQWGTNTNCLSTDGTNQTACMNNPILNTAWNDPYTGIRYTPGYIIDSPAGFPNLRRVRVTITWNENQPQ